MQRSHDFICLEPSVVWTVLYDSAPTFLLKSDNPKKHKQAGVGPVTFKHVVNDSQLVNVDRECGTLSFSEDMTQSKWSVLYFLRAQVFEGNLRFPIIICFV